ncbi:glycoside hydrolase family 2 TIM barrel-domain containing protein [Aridibaculum aurantiacum]|uniref:glycoside hydrolase family 2 TIM barrel-domain containing protein n=1 Tax=Aridibaculum aurantiacum TaxID=2810307 RepID=UPI001A979B36|nr:glycoside hydrolase family 2 TIM barrel-domain containing protein [Aridibaculum aurantiacum]
MNTRLQFSLLFILVLACTASAQTSSRNILFDKDWRFYLGNDTAARLSSFNDAGWRKLDLPHDWSIEDIPGTNSPFSADAISGVSGGFTVGGTGWYRKSFTIPAAQKGKRVVVQFDGVYMNADFWINGHHLGNHPYGYTSFAYDLTDHIDPNGTNVIAVQVKNEGRNSRWYSGSGIYRHVWLNYLQPVHVAQWGTFVTTPKVTKAGATVNVKTKVQNETAKPASIKLVTIVKDGKGVEKARKTSQQTIAANNVFELSQDINVTAPKLWSLEAPALYTAVTEVYNNNQLADVVTTPFGIRTISFDAVNGFQLNGKTVKLKGGCVHHDNGALGAKAYDRAEERKVELLKASGYNAIRTSHNPPSPYFLEVCDRLGMLVIDEAFDTWNERKNRQDYHLYFEDWWQRDLQSMIYRDRNHPSIIMWSTGNEIPNRGKPEVAAVAKKLSDYVKTLDTTRPVTAGVNGIDQNPEAFLAALDVAGYNYAEASYEGDHEKFPNRVMYGAESFALDAYDYWMDVVDMPWVIGDFVWTSFDYIGEASIGWLGYPQNKNFFPWNLAYCGDIDVCGWKRPQSHYRDALWMKDKVSVFVKPPKPTFAEWNEKLETWARWHWHDVVANWTFPGYEDSTLDVSVFSSADEVELFLNNKSLGRKPTNRSNKYTANFNVPYAKGELKAVGYTNNKQVTSSVLRTAGNAAKLKLTADRTVINKADDLSYITVEVVDANGVRLPNAEELVKFTVDGPATIVGVANANPKSLESLTKPQRTTWQGRCQVIIKSNGKAGTINLKATAAGLPVATVAITAK